MTTYFVVNTEKVKLIFMKGIHKNCSLYRLRYEIQHSFLSTGRVNYISVSSKQEVECKFFFLNKDIGNRGIERAECLMFLSFFIAYVSIKEFEDKHFEEEGIFCLYTSKYKHYSKYFFEVI